ncbi:hypothetical protein MNBD_ALPHA11-1537 [hydrothermal vent metagenome]|uniref:VOC domain-containing protein n=1 Tax=hydrothermal vent metagenome TaxID=652676 RepID=A0A3B0UC58_9ZZZZ
MEVANCIATAAVFIVADLRKSTNWYIEQLGFVAAELNWDENPTFSIVRCEGAAIMLKQGGKKSLDNRQLANRHYTPGDVVSDVYFWVQDLKKIELSLKVGNTPIFAGPIKRSYGCTEIMVVDPDDYLICFGRCP